MIPLPVVEGGFRCIVADPPWSFRDKGSRLAPEQAPGGRYETMRLRDICRLPVEAAAAPDSLLLLWTTSAHILDGSAVKVCDAWGFHPKTTIAWVKIRERATSVVLAEDRRARADGIVFGAGHYTRAAHELVVVARRGRAKVLRRDVPSVFFAPRGRHSAKPELFQDIIETLVDGPRLEMFARRERVGWTCWGDQLPGIARAA